VLTVNHSPSIERQVFPLHDVELTTPNEHELAAMHEAAKSNNYLERQDWWTVIDAMGIPSTGIGLQLQELTSRELVDRGIPQRMIQLLPFVPVIITKLGAKGSLPLGFPYVAKC
jgi:pseudouridylate synthase / pseudouridine kinase